MLTKLRSRGHQSGRNLSQTHEGKSFIFSNLGAAGGAAAGAAGAGRDCKSVPKENCEQVAVPNCRQIAEEQVQWFVAVALSTYWLQLFIFWKPQLLLAGPSSCDSFSNSLEATAGSLDAPFLKET